MSTEPTTQPANDDAGTSTGSGSEISRSNPSIAELGHVGIRCHDVGKQLDFYTKVLSLQVTDHDSELGIWFLSSRPDEEHHELLLAAGRNVGSDAKLIQQISFRCPTLEDVIGFLHRFRETATPIDMVVSHGNAVGVYFYDPEGNRCEVYWQTGWQAAQPFVEHIDLDLSTPELLEQLRESVERYGAQGYQEESYRQWTLETGGAQDDEEKT